VTGSENEVRIEENRPRRGGRSALTALIIALVITNIGLTAYVFYTRSSENTILRGQVSELTSSLQGLSNQLAESNARLTSLNFSIANSGGIPQISSGLDAVKIFEAVKDSVVFIKVTVRLGTVQGSGFVYNTQGIIVTNNHVIEGALSGGIAVTFLNGTTVKATVVGADQYSDIAVIRVDAPTSLLKPLRLGSSSALRVGEPVLAIGNPYGLADTLTQGIVSALGREMDSGNGYVIVDVIQTDAPINPGNSGGPLLNAAGEVVGINTAIPSQTSNGIGFAVSSDTISMEVASLISTGGYDHAYIGINGADLSPGVLSAMSLGAGTHGALVVTVTLGGPADRAGVKGGTRIVTVDGAPLRVGGDVITGADGNDLKNFYGLLLYIQRTKRPGDIVTLSVLRDGAKLDIAVTLGVRPPTS